MSSNGWTTKTSKASRTKKVAAFNKQTTPEQEKKNKPNKRRSRNSSGSNSFAYNTNSYDPEDIKQQYRLNGQQYRTTQRIARAFPDCNLEHILPKLVTELNITRFNPINERQKIEILDFIDSELRSTMIGNKGNNKKKQIVTKSNGKVQKQPTKQPKKQRKKKKKSGKFRQCMAEVAHIFMPFNDSKTISKLFQVDAFRRGLHFKSKQRLIAYTEPNDIIFRLKSFNAKCNALSSLKLYEIKKAPKSMSVLNLMYMMICNGLMFENRFKGRHETDHFVAMDMSRNNKKYDFAQRVIREKCKVFNEWQMMDIEDVNEAYLTEFGEFHLNKYQNANALLMTPGVDGKEYLKHLDSLLLDTAFLTKENIKSMHCVYCKVLNYPKLLSYLWIFIELNTKNRREKNKKGIQQFMVWKAQCGEFQIKPHKQ